MELFYMIGFFLLLYARFCHKDIIRVEWDKVGAFLGFLAFLTCLRIGAFDFAERMNIDFLKPGNPHFLMERGIWRLAMVWWEDMFYVFPMFFIVKKFPKWLAGILILFLSMDFGAGHMYQGIFGVMITSIYPYFISYRYGRNNGLGTVMVCHIMYDFVTVLTLLAHHNMILW